MISGIEGAPSGASCIICSKRQGGAHGWGQFSLGSGGAPGSLDAGRRRVTQPGPRCWEARSTSVRCAGRMKTWWLRWELGIVTRSYCWYLQSFIPCFVSTEAYDLSPCRQSRRGTTFTLGDTSWLDGFQHCENSGLVFAASLIHDNSILLMQWKNTERLPSCTQPNNQRLSCTQAGSWE